jgi:hypothetical protein
MVWGLLIARVKTTSSPSVFRCLRSAQGCDGDPAGKGSINRHKVSFL